MTLSERSPQALHQPSPPVLETERLVLRAPQLADAPAIAALANEPRIAENSTRIPHPYTVADAEDFIAGVKLPAGELPFAVTLRDDTLIGICALVQPAGFALEAPEGPELGYWIGVPFWGKGYATEAVRALIDYAFTELDHETLLARARVTNPASRRVLEKCGFQWTGVGLYRIRAIASSAPIDRFRLERRIWASLKSWREVRRLS